MSSLQQEFSSGQTRGQAQTKVEEMSQSVKDSACEAKDRTIDAAHNVPDAQESKEQASGFLQQTGEQAKSMAQSAMDTVKSTLGVSDKTN